MTLHDVLNREAQSVSVPYKLTNTPPRVGLPGTLLLATHAALTVLLGSSPTGRLSVTVAPVVVPVNTTSTLKSKACNSTRMRRVKLNTSARDVWLLLTAAYVYW